MKENETLWDVVKWLKKNHKLKVDRESFLENYEFCRIVDKYSRLLQLAATTGGLPQIDSILKDSDFVYAAQLRGIAREIDEKISLTDIPSDLFRDGFEDFCASWKHHTQKGRIAEIGKSVSGEHEWIYFGALLNDNQVVFLALACAYGFTVSSLLRKNKIQDPFSPRQGVVPEPFNGHAAALVEMMAVCGDGVARTLASPLVRRNFGFSQMVVDIANPPKIALSKPEQVVEQNEKLLLASRLIKTLNGQQPRDPEIVNVIQWLESDPKRMATKFIKDLKEAVLTLEGMLQVPRKLPGLLGFSLDQNSAGERLPIFSEALEQPEVIAIINSINSADLNSSRILGLMRLGAIKPRDFQMSFEGFDKQMLWDRFSANFVLIITTYAISKIIKSPAGQEALIGSALVEIMKSTRLRSGLVYGKPWQDAFLAREGTSRLRG